MRLEQSGTRLRVDAALAFEDAEDDRLHRRAPASLAPHATRAEVRLVDLHLAALERPAAFALVGEPLAQAEVNLVDGADRHAAKPGTIGRGQVQGEQAENLPEPACIQLRAFVVAVSHGDTEVKSTSGRSSAS